FQSTLDPATGKTTFRPMLDQAKLHSDRVAAGGRFKSAWEGCAALWSGRADDVDVRELFHYAHKVCSSLLGVYIFEHEQLLLRDINHLIKLHAEAAPHGAPSVYQIGLKDEAGTLNLQYKPIDLLICVEALAAIDGARTTLGKPPLDRDADPR